MWFKASEEYNIEFGSFGVTINICYVYLFNFVFRMKYTI